MTLQKIKDYLVERGPDDPLVRNALSLHARLHGFRLRFDRGVISIIRGSQEMMLDKRLFVQVPIMMECYDLFFNTIQSSELDGRSILDFSKPGKYRYKESGAEFFFPSIPEDYVMDAYTFWYVPQPGDTVWDVGAYAGATTYFFSKLVGPEGRVVAFEPDELNYSYLIRNVAHHNLSNVVPVKKGLDSRSGTAQFNMDGTMAAGIQTYLAYDSGKHCTSISTLSLPDACTELGVPKFIKMDIEGAEVAVIAGATNFLKSHPIHFAIESYHPIAGERSFKPLERAFSEISYDFLSSSQFGQMFTWARPGGHSPD